jgi:hypothetical protein
MRFLCTHTVPPNALSAVQIRQVSEAAQKDPKVRGYRSFFNLSAGKVFCVLEAKDEREITDWFQKMNLPYDAILPVEYEGERGMIRAEPPVPVGATA